MRHMKLAALAAAFVVPASSFAVVAFSTFGPGDVYDTLSGHSISGPASIPGSVSPGFQFIPTVSGSLVSLELALFRLAGNGNAQVSLSTDNADTVGTTITSWFFGGIVSGGSIITLPNGFPGIVLNAGQKYWITAQTTGSEWSGWHRNNQGVFLPRVTSNNGGGTWNFVGRETAPAFRVNVVPEPATMLVLGAGLAALAARRRRRA